jgi:hypothetical protein
MIQQRGKWVPTEPTKPPLARQGAQPTPDYVGSVGSDSGHVQNILPRGDLTPTHEALKGHSVELWAAKDCLWLVAGEANPAGALEPVWRGDGRIVVVITDPEIVAEVTRLQRQCDETEGAIERGQR